MLLFLVGELRTPQPSPMVERRSEESRLFALSRSITAISFDM